MSECTEFVNRFLACLYRQSDLYDDNVPFLHSEVNDISFNVSAICLLSLRRPYHEFIF